MRLFIRKPNQLRIGRLRLAARQTIAPRAKQHQRAELRCDMTNVEGEDSRHHFGSIITHKANQQGDFYEEHAQSHTQDDS